MSTFPAFKARDYDFCAYETARNYTGGEWSDAQTGKTADVMNPRHGKAMAKVVMSGRTDIDRAVQAAAKAQKEWASWPVRERGQVLYQLRDQMREHAEELAWLCSHENGKTFAESAAEVAKAIECLEYGCSIPNLGAGQQLDVSRGVNCETTYTPLGVVAGVVPFNFPLMVPFWMLPQALMGGNAFIMKPSEQVPLSLCRLISFVEQTDLPRGVLSIVQGGQEAVEALCDHEGISALAFVGSTRVAKLVYSRSAAAGKRALCLGGAKNHLMMVPDADPTLTAQNVVASFTGCAGQRCMAASVLVAVGEVDPIIDAIKKQASQIKIGEDMGAIITQGAVERITGYIEGAQKDGAKLLLDGRGQRANDQGYWVGPTIIDGCKPSDAAACEEIFGPVISIVRVKTLDEAIAIENNNPYGNAACIYTTSGKVARYVTERAQAGMVGVNIGVPVPREPFGFGGWNDSKFGHGDITGWDGYRFWTRIRKVTSKWETQKDATWMS